MVKNIVLLSDGTGNAASNVWRTNVWRFFQALDLTNSKQVAAYDDGVGTSAFKPLALFGGAFGWGLKRNVIELYKFLCRNYEPGCDIYALGFSRGAFTIRVLMGLVANQGIVQADGESDLHRKAKLAYRAYRRERYHTIHHFEIVLRAFRDVAVWLKNKIRGHGAYDKAQNVEVPAIRFIGVWDTVAAYGLPLEEMTHGVSLWLWPLELPDRTLSKKASRACHAVALDDERTTFHPVLWSEDGEAPAKTSVDGRRLIKDERISQVWFSGVHANVGGGYPDDSLAHVSLCWMMKEAERCGIRFKKAPQADPDAMLHAISNRDKDGRLYDSRRGLGGYYRYGPRKIAQLSKMRFSRVRDDAVKIELPKIHTSAFERGIDGAHVYAPIGVPKTYAVVTEEGEILSGPNNPYESVERAARRADGQEHVWNLVWWRRLVYFLTVGASAYLFLFPLIYQTNRVAEYTTPFRVMSEALRLAGAFLPGFFSFWINSYTTNPGRFLFGLFLVAFLIWIGTRLGREITDRMRRMWLSQPDAIPALPRGGVYALRTHWLYQWVLWGLKRQVVPLISVAAIVYCVVTIGSHLLFNFWDAAGAHCQETEEVVDVPWQDEIVIEKPFRNNELCWASGVRLVEGRFYRFTIVQASPSWEDGSPLRAATYPAGLGGFEIAGLPSIGDRAIMIAGIPLRRVFLRPWFRIIGRIGSIGTDEYFFDPRILDGAPEGKEQELTVSFTPRRGGELFLYLNDAVIGWPRFADFFHRGNVGQADVKIRHLPR